MKIILTGGGTAGHVTPHLAILPTLLSDGHEVHYVGSETGIEKDIIGKIDGVVYHAIATGKLRRYHDKKNLQDIAHVVKGIRQATELIRSLKPDVVFSKGGYVAYPVVVGAHLNHVPVLIHESDMTSGLANKLCKPFAKAVLTTFPETAKAEGKKGIYVGAPIRKELLNGSREKGLKTFGFNESKPILLIVGGSLGAQAINRAVRGALDELTQCFQILHICGNGNLDYEYEGTHGYVQTQYLDSEMADALACADIVVSRAGSNSICELLALCKPALLIPYPSDASRGDQIVNAESFERRGFARVLDQKDLTKETLVQRIIEVYRNRGELIDSMEREPRQESAKKIVELIYQYAKK